MTSLAKRKYGALATLVILLGTAVWPGAVLASIADPSFYKFHDCDHKYVSDQPFPAAYRTLCQQHLQKGHAAEDNPLSLASNFPTCTSPRVGSKMYCIRLLQGAKLIQETMESYISTDFPTETNEYCGSPGNCITAVEFTPEGEQKFHDMSEAYEVIFANDGYAAVNVVFKSLAAAQEGLPELDPSDYPSQQIRSDFVLQAATHFNTLDESCGNAREILSAKSGSGFVEYPGQIKEAFQSCLDNVRQLTPRVLEALNKMDPQQSGSFNPGGGVGTSGSVLGLPLPLSDVSLPQIIGGIIRAILSVVGALALAAFVWGGLQWMLAAGDSKKIESAKGTVKAAVVGLVVIFSSYAILSFIINALTN